MVLRGEGDGRPIALVINTGEAIGDVLTRIPCYRALRRAFPNHRIVDLCRHSSSLLEPLRAIAAELVDEIRCGQPLNGGLLNLRRLIKAIGNVELIIDLRSNLGALGTYIATLGLPVRYGANVALFGLRRGVSLIPERRPEANCHRFHRLVELLAGRSLPFEPLVEVHAEARQRAEALVPHGTRFVVLAPGGSASGKAWPAPNWTRLAAYLHHRAILPVFLLGPPETLEAQWIRRDRPDASIIDVTAADQAHELPWLFHALADRALGAIAVEGGIGHLLASRGRPLLTISGPTNARRWRPATPRHWSIAARDFGSRRTADVPYEAVRSATDEMIRAAEGFHSHPGPISPA